MPEMEITDFGFFRVRDPNPGEVPLLYFENGDGQDWYEMRFGLTTWNEQDGSFETAVYGAWALCDEQGVVLYVDQDPSKLMPGDRTILGIDADYWDIKPGMIWDGTQLLPPPPPTPETLQ